MVRTLATGEPFRYEGRFYRASDHALRWFEFTGALHCDDRGRPRRMVGTVLDVTERKEMDEKLRLREERYRTLLTSMDEGFCVVELVHGADGTVVDHRFLEANPAFERHTGLLDPVGKSARDMAPSIEQHWNAVSAR
ncbi:PAS domain-containing protein [Massilia sp. Se16.2.3]|uniref:PAS domain-containing protein n=1 Tax=Massilia sp. Se16.2.3 TaxID=2709303 RepID=UPI0035A707F6